MPPVLLLNMPFANLRWPNLGPSLLKAGLARRGIGCEVAYLNYDFAEQVGLENYQWIADHFAFVLGGERLFGKHYFGGRLPSDDGYYQDVLVAADARFGRDERRAYEDLGRCVGPFLDRAMESLDWSRYAIVGFSTTFQQTLASLCLARRIKAARPEIRIVFGGAACEGEMGVELLRQFAEIDYVFLGESDLTFPPVVEQILDGRPVPPCPGVVGREWLDLGPGEGDQESSMVRDLDELPYPDFDDFFARRAASPLAAEVDPLLVYETSRGCWWGQKHHCVFCGLNGGTMAFRSKSPGRAIGEIRYLVGRHGVRRASATDNIFDHRYFTTLLPMLRDSGLGLSFEYELKANLTRGQVELLVDAGLGAAQLGIETFSTPMLRAMNKGATAVQNLQTLKWFSETGIEVKWNLLYGFPGTSPDDDRDLVRLLPSLAHLEPPQAVGRVRADRFSPYFESPEAYGIVRLRPHRAFGYVYPFAPEVLARMAYYFEHDQADGRDPEAESSELVAAAEAWQQAKGAAAFRQVDRPDGVLVLHDTRPCAATFQRRLTGLDREIYLHCDTGRTLAALVQFVAARAAEPPDLPRLQRLLAGWVEEHLMVLVDSRYLSLALWTPAARGR